MKLNLYLFAITIITLLSCENENQITNDLNNDNDDPVIDLHERIMEIKNSNEVLSNQQFENLVEKMSNENLHTYEQDEIIIEFLSLNSNDYLKFLEIMLVEREVNILDLNKAQLLKKVEHFIGDFNITPNLYLLQNPEKLNEIYEYFSSKSLLSRNQFMCSLTENFPDIIRFRASCICNTQYPNSTVNTVNRIQDDSCYYRLIYNNNMGHLRTLNTHCRAMIYAHGDQMHANFATRRIAVDPLIAALFGLGPINLITMLRTTK